jgi:hypothetical protein
MMARGKRHRVQATYESYLLEVVGTESSYSLSTAVPRHEDGIYTEHWHLEFQAKCLAPPKIAGRPIRLIFIARRDYFDRPASVDKAWRPLGVAHLTMRGEQSELLGSLPYDAAWGIATNVANGSFKYVALNGEPLKRGTAQISYMAFGPTYDPREYFD